MVGALASMFLQRMAIGELLVQANKIGVQVASCYKPRSGTG